MKNIVIADLDGTIALIDHRRHLVEGKKKDWRQFFAECDKDRPNFAVIYILTGLKRLGYRIVILSGRSDEVRDKTIQWLSHFRVPYAELKMRKAGDHTPDEKLKEEWLKDLNIDDILCVFDDRQKVVDMWRRNGLVCLQVAPGDF